MPEPTTPKRKNIQDATIKQTRRLTNVDANTRARLRTLERITVPTLRKRLSVLERQVRRILKELAKRT